MLDVNIEKILPITAVRDALNKIIDEVESGEQLYVVTKNGKPAAIIVGVHHLEKLTGIHHKEIMPDEDDNVANDIPVATSTDESEKTAMDDISAVPSQTPADETPLADQTQSLQTDESDFDDLFLAPETTTSEPTATNPQISSVAEPIVAQPVANQPTPQENLLPVAETPLQPQPQPVQQTVETFAVPVSTPQDNAPVPNAVAPQPQTNQTNLQQ